ncbi:Eukaryotic translation initiation factor 4E [Entamoeba marina]
MESPLPSSQIDQHVLMYKWTYWFNSNKNESQSSVNLTSIEEVYTFDTVEKFWGLYDGLEKATTFIKGTDCYIVKDGTNHNNILGDDGGKITFEAPLNSEEAERYWRDIVLMCIGSDFDLHENVVGVEISIRSAAKYTVYINNCTEEDAKLFKREIVDYLDLSPKHAFKFFKGGKRHDIS